MLIIYGQTCKKYMTTSDLNEKFHFVSLRIDYKLNFINLGIFLIEIFLKRFNILIILI